MQSAYVWCGAGVLIMNEQGTQEWLEARKYRVTGSVVGSILFDYPQKRSDIMRSMVREYHDAPCEVNEYLENVIFAHGKFYEPHAKSDYELETGNTIEPCGFFEYEEWLGASPDGLINDLGLAEIKCPYKENVSHKADDQPHYYAQMQIEMLCANRTWVHFYQWASTAQTLETVYFDQDWIDKYLPILRKFYDEYLHERKNNYQKYLDPKRRSIDNQQAKKLVDEYEELQDAIDRANERKKAVLSSLVEISGGENAIICGKSLSKVEKAGAVAYAKIVKEKLPELDLDPYRGKASEYWVLK